MKKLTLFVFFAIASTILILSNCEQGPKTPTTVGGPASVVCKFNKSFQLAPVLPDLTITDNCLAAQYAWQTFMFLNWPGDPNNPGEPDMSKTIADFGKPAVNETPAVWESYKDIFDIFKTTVPDTTWATQDEFHCDRPIKMTDKTSEESEDHIQEVEQAFTSWLTDIDGNLAFYEVRVNKDEFEFIVKNELYNQSNLAPFAANNGGFWLPDGSTPEYPMGAMEVKVAWKIVTDPADINKYFTIKACIPAVTLNAAGTHAVIASDATYSEQTVGMVGMHVAWKTSDAPQWLWATFEHKDNVPTTAEAADPKQKYTFFDPNSRIGVNAQPNNPDSLSDLSTPCKVTRVDEIDPNVVALNKEFHAMLSKANSSSVFVNYDLIGLTWPQTPVAGNANPNTANPGLISYVKPDQVFLAKGDPQPGEFLRNSTMESYLTTGKNKSSCITCHSQAYLPPFSNKEPIWASDYSWIFTRAQIIQ